MPTVGMSPIDASPSDAEPSPPGSPGAPPPPPPPYSPPRDGRTIREDLGYLSMDQAKARAVGVFLGNRYTADPRPLPTRTTSHTIHTQSDFVDNVAAPTADGNTHDGGGDNGNDDADGHHHDQHDKKHRDARHHDLALGLCSPHDLPVMAVAQLLEAEHRVADLLNRLEEEIARAEDERRRRQIDDDAFEDAEASLAARCATSTSAWNERMKETIDRRLRRRHKDPSGTTPSVFWHRAKLDYVGSPMRARQDMSSPTRERSAMLAAGKAAPMPRY